MNILLIGYGKMGKTIEKIALDRGHTIVGRMDPKNGEPLEKIGHAEVAIEFTQADAAAQNIRFCIENQIPVVCGTTGWLHQKQEVEDYCLARNGTFFYASNFSLGVNLFFKLNEYLARLMQGHAYEVSLDETHHTAKKDAPSGTAITLAEGILKHTPSKKKWTNQDSQDPHDLVIHSFRVDPAPGTHTVKYASPVDTIEITHTAHSREGFALGAVLVAEWLRGKKGLLTMHDFLK